MRLKLSLTAGPRGQAGQTEAHIFDDRGGIIGRGDDCAWRLHCPERLVSRRHCVVTLEGNSFYVYDASANGVFVNDASEPLGQGNRHRVADGDILKLGDFVVQASLLDRAAESPGPERHAPPGELTAPPRLEHSADASIPDATGDAAPAEPPAPPEQPVPATTIRPAAIGHPAEAFTPPAAHIPEDWNLELDPLESEGPDQGSVAQLLDALEPATTRALLEGMGIELQAGQGFLVEAPTARVIGELLASAVETAMALQAEYVGVDRQISGRDPEQAAPIAGHEDSRAFLHALLTEPDDAARTRMAEELRAALAKLPGQHRALAEVLGGSVASVVEQFSPHKGRQRARRRIAEPRGRGAALRRLWRRLRYWVAPGAECWRSYECWFEAQGGDTYRALNKLFEKKTAALYAQHPKPSAASPARAAAGRAPGQWQGGAAGGQQG